MTDSKSETHNKSKITFFSNKWHSMDNKEDLSKIYVLDQRSEDYDPWAKPSYQLFLKMNLYWT